MSKIEIMMKNREEYTALLEHTRTLALENSQEIHKTLGRLPDLARLAEQELPDDYWDMIQRSTIDPCYAGRLVINLESMYYVFGNLSFYSRHFLEESPEKAEKAKNVLFTILDQLTERSPLRVIGYLKNDHESLLPLDKRADLFIKSLPHVAVGPAERDDEFVCIDPYGTSYRDSHIIPLAFYYYNTLESQQDKILREKAEVLKSAYEVFCDKVRVLSIGDKDAEASKPCNLSGPALD